MFPLLIDLRISASREIDPLKAARGLFKLFDDGMLGIFPAFGNHQRVPRFDFLNLVVVDVKSRFNSGFFRGNDDHLIIGVKIGRSYSGRIPYYKGRA